MAALRPRPIFGMCIRWFVLSSAVCNRPPRRRPRAAATTAPSCTPASNRNKCHGLTRQSTVGAPAGARRRRCSRRRLFPSAAPPSGPAHPNEGNARRRVHRQSSFATSTASSSAYRSWLPINAITCAFACMLVCAHARACERARVRACERACMGGRCSGRQSRDDGPARGQLGPAIIKNNI